MILKNCWWLSSAKKDFTEKKNNKKRREMYYDHSFMLFLQKSLEVVTK